MENSGLVVFPTHRIVRDLENFDVNAVIEKSKDYFDIETDLSRTDSTAKLDKAYKDGKKAFVLYCDDVKGYLPYGKTHADCKQGTA